MTIDKFIIVYLMLSNGIKWILLMLLLEKVMERKEK